MTPRLQVDHRAGLVVRFEVGADGGFGVAALLAEADAANLAALGEPEHGVLGEREQVGEVGRRIVALDGHGAGFSVSASAARARYSLLRIECVPRQPSHRHPRLYIASVPC